MRPDALNKMNFIGVYGPFWTVFKGFYDNKRVTIKKTHSFSNCSKCIKALYLSLKKPITITMVVILYLFFSFLG